ncbi:MAG: hypothetical protein K9M56_07835 [Victivallales bacterium]|nr:hypothetical protein [Victivallales bacterium]
MDDTIYLVDAYAHIYRGYFAVKNLTTSDGKPSNAVFAMSKFLLQLEKEFSPNLGAFVFDLGAPKRRLDLAPDYKANRAHMPDEMRCQIDDVRSLIESAGWNIVEVENFEADDVIASIANRFSDREIKILSNDKDVAQVVNENVEMFITVPGKKGFKLRDKENVVEKFDVKPSQIIDYLAMIGDSSDNIPGVEGIGPKTAASLLKQFGSIDEMLAKTEEIQRERIKKKVQSSSDLLKKNRELIRLDNDIVSDSYNSLEKLELRLPNLNEIERIAKEYQLKNVLKEFTEIFKNKSNPMLFDI